MIRVFHPDDTMLLDPIDLENSLLDLFNSNIENEYNLIIYESGESDVVKVTIRDGVDLFSFSLDRHMRIAQLIEQYNKDKNRNRILCYEDTKAKIYERYTI
eukprot:CAMPEP_0114594542 /NCGR_PEP_ID=MMETSP0125-20121206/16207_1 /TAXON_ID=485358 ORGANISM="Aristerostoma sp., Strain ATCC 50986" /NCGR_SAMPLE_ID=MMETSP0125 /ASSEMBLY_ACC=CAM_ASM_000245 /LENGTH=100 /DNA_ID=CAMNT_0001794967 /DNA_START=326 /DNA_END=628 /DNA_ORIENTATION=-